MTSGLPSFQHGAAMMGAAPAMMGVQMGEVAPPPGTLGRTYQLRSRPIPTKMHPRVGMVDIRVPGATEVLVHDLNEFRTEDSLDGFQDAYDPTVWHFESEPLLPGLPHIYRVEAKFPDGQMQERYIRLIMGRLVELDF
ncbi:MAG: hypothetical protein KDA80_08565 [Planctomycetaceae bacterium]|nr:hypothetical protein [Planctomycetaceae bacterium]